MKLRIALAAGAALALGACGKSGAPEAAATASAEAAPAETAAPAAPESSAAAPAAAAAKGAVPTRDYFIGKWAESGDCSMMAIEFKADGSMVGPFEKWEPDGKGVLTMVGNPQKIHLTVVDQDTVESRINGTEKPRKLTRCK